MRRPPFSQMAAVGASKRPSAHVFLFRSVPARTVTLTLPTRAENQLCRHFGGHALTRSRTGAAHLGALLDHLIVSSYLHAAVGALSANLSTKPAHSFVKR
jgi:hypothetical protein